MPQLMVREKYDVWEAAGGLRAEERARDRVHDLIANYQPEPLPAEAVRELKAIYEAEKKSEGVI